MPVTLLYIGAGVLLMALSIPMIRRRIAPNLLYGLRVRATFADERVWYEANARAGRDLFRIGLGICILAIALRLIPGVTEPSYTAILSIVILVAAVAAGVADIRYANRLLAARRASGDQLNPVDPLRKGALRSMLRK